MSKPQQSTFTPLKTRALRVGFVPLTDCAPLVMAAELGLFRKYGLNVMLSRELGWATIRDKIIYGELDAAHAVAGLPMAATLGLGSVPCECVTGLVLNLHGNGITLSNELCCRGVTDAASLRTQIKLPRSGRALTFGIVSAVSSHNFLLRGWLAAAGINPDRDVRIVVVPPPQMVANLKSGNLDGFCVGEPWNSVAVQARAGVCVAVSSQLEPGHPEKVLMVRREFAEKREPEHFALMAALLEACAFCDEPANHELLVEVLARPQYVGAAAAALRCGIMGEFALVGGQPCRVADFNVFHRNDANEPGGDKAAWVLQHMRSCGQHQEPSDFNFALGRRVFRIDLFEQALRLREANAAPNHHEQPNNELSFA